MAKQVLHRADVIAPFQQFRGERMPECVATGALADTCLLYGITNRSLNRRYVAVVPGNMAEIIGAERRRREKPLPFQSLAGIGIFSCQCERKADRVSKFFAALFPGYANGFDMIL